MLQRKVVTHVTGNNIMSRGQNHCKNERAKRNSDNGKVKINHTQKNRYKFSFIYSAGNQRWNETQMLAQQANERAECSSLKKYLRAPQKSVAYRQSGTGRLQMAKVAQPYKSRENSEFSGRTLKNLLKLKKTKPK